MNSLLLVIGVIIYLGVVADIVATTLSLQGGGWLTNRLGIGFWRLLLNASGHKGSAKLLEHAGYLLLLLILLVWVGLLWSSFFLLLLADADSIVNSLTKQPADAWQKLYYAGFTVSTLGVGDYVAATNGWRIITSIFSFSGLTLITVSITYLVPVLSAANKQNNLGVMLNSLGQSPQEIVVSNWTGEDFSRLTEQASSLASQIINHNNQHKTYPVIHYFHNSQFRFSVVSRLATLYEALFILKAAVKADLQPPAADLAPLMTAMQHYLQVVEKHTNIEANTEVKKPLPPINQLKGKGLAEAFSGEQIADFRKGRSIFVQLLKQDGWSIDQVHSGDSAG